MFSKLSSKIGPGAFLLSEGAQYYQEAYSIYKIQSINGSVLNNSKLIIAEKLPAITGKIRENDYLVKLNLMIYSFRIW